MQKEQVPSIPAGVRAALVVDPGAPVESWCWDCSCPWLSLGVPAKGGHDRGRVLRAAGTLLPQKTELWRELQSSSSYWEPKAGCEPHPIRGLGQRAGGSVGGVSVGRELQQIWGGKGSG